MPRVVLDGVGLHYHRRPGAPVVVLVHGLATNVGFWYLKVLPALRADFGVLLFDLRGHGQSDTPPSGYTTKVMAQDLDALLQGLGIERAHVVGHSYGGAVALHHAVLHPERVLSLTLADARIRCLQPSQRLAHWPKSVRRLGLKNAPVRIEDGPEMGLGLLEALAGSSRRPGAPNGTLGGPVASGAFSPFGLSRGRDRTAKQWLSLLRTTTARREFEQVSGLTVARVGEVRQPVLAIFGEYSPCLRSLRGLQKTLSDCRVVIVPDAGHFHPVVRPRFFAGAVETFIDDVGPRV